MSNLANFSVFGTRPQNSIFMPQVPFNLRNDCRAGQWKVGEEDFRGKEIEISIIKVAQFFGNLGKINNSFWLQVWFVSAPSCDILPKNTVCLTYLKKRSIAQFSQKVTELMESGEPALGIFKGSFLKHNGDKGDYYSVAWDWRERETEQEMEQLEYIADFMATTPKLVDLSVNLIPIDGLSPDEIELLMSSAKANELEGSALSNGR
ncbi:hypothetical protein PCC7424_2409 [Gloeothece citriformis PCC 7424]|uniref:Uncharacterized protein n=1 Tax=Gloeothece citriformis (strain PCC 7424) TaxID=65393 RepID=B7KIZ4_GLOC7|nr:hypothetical protein [Gloeothece citriformis]ACK70830.1 hypothetical protein PCC7424_2409 [Gloeothece citriformis PCC 7424]